MSSFNWPPLPSSGGSGTVTSVALADASSPQIFTVTNSPVTSSGTLTLTLNPGVVALLGGVSGGQVFNGGTAASNNLTLQSTSNGTKGYVSVVDGSTLALGPSGTAFGPPSGAGISGLPLLILEQNGIGSAIVGTASNTGGPGIVFGRERGTFGSPAFLQNTDIALALSFKVFNTATPFDTQVAGIAAAATQNHSSSLKGTALSLLATANGSGSNIVYLSLGGASTNGVQFPTLLSGALTADGSGNLSTVAPEANDNVLTSNGSSWVSRQLLALFNSSNVQVDGTLSSTTFVAFTNAPSLTFTPPVTGVYKVEGSFPFYSSAGNESVSLKIQNTAGSATVIFEQETPVSTPGIGLPENASPYGVYTLTGGVSYTFTVYGKNSGAPVSTLTLGNSIPATGTIVLAYRLQ